MPPNRPAVATVIRSISANDLEGFVTESKYAPLTWVPTQGEIELRESRDAVKTAPQHLQDAEEERPQVDEPAFYWTWPSRSDAQPEVEDAILAEDAEWQVEEARRRAVVAQILADEAARSAVSTACIEARLKADAAKVESADVIRSTQARKDGYWEWDAGNDAREEAAVAVVAALSSFFDIRTEDTIVKKKPIQIKVRWRSPRVRDEDHSERPVVRAPHTSDPTHPNNKYWDWSPPTNAEETRRGLLDKVLADEEARRALSAARTEEMLRIETERHAAMEQERWNDFGMGMGGEGCYWDM